MIRLARKSIVVAALMASTSAIANSGWSVSEASGSVTITRGEKVIQARKDSRLNEGDVIRTGKGARAVLVRGKEYLVVSPKAHIRIAEPEKAGPVTQIFQYLGNVLFKIEKKSTPHFGVETPYMAAVVKGTTFNVSVGDDGTSVQVTEGAVEVTTGDDLEAALLTPGLVGLVEADAIGDLIVISNDPDGPSAEEATVRGTPSFVPALSQPAAEAATTIANAGGNSDRGPGRAGDTAPALLVAIGAVSGAQGGTLDSSNDDIADNGAEDESSAVQDFVISESGDGESGTSEIVTQKDSSETAPAAEKTDADVNVSIADDRSADESDGGSGNTDLAYAEDQDNGSCAGVPNCSGGANPNKSDAIGDPATPDDDVGIAMGVESPADEVDDDAASGDESNLDTGVATPADEGDNEEVEVSADLGLGADNDDSDDDGPGNGNGNGNSGGNNGNANGVGNGNGGGNGNGNNGNGNGNGGPSSDDGDDEFGDDDSNDEASDEDVGVGAGIDGPVDASDNEEVDVGADLGLGSDNDDSDDEGVGNGNGNGNSGGNNGNANGIGNGNGGGNGNGNNGNGNGNGGPSSDDGAEGGVGVDLGVDLGGEGGADVDLGADLDLGMGADEGDDDDESGERGERGEGGEGGNGRGRGRGRGNND